MFHISSSNLGKSEILCLYESVANSMSMHLSKIGSPTWSCILLTMCFSHGMPHSTKGFFDGFQQTNGNMGNLLKMIPIIDTIYNGNRRLDDDFSVKNPFEGAHRISEGSKENDMNPLGAIIDYPVPERLKGKFENHTFVREDEESSEKQDSNESSVEETGDECGIKYFYDIKYEFTSCWLDGHSCYLEYNEFRTVIPDTNRCLLENDKCTLTKEVRDVMLPFVRKECRKYRKRTRNSDEPNVSTAKEKNCEFQYITELTLSELYCQLKNGDCYLGNENEITIIKDEDNCKIEKGQCIQLREFETNIPFVSKDCHIFNQPIEIRQTPIYNKDTTCEIYQFLNTTSHRKVVCHLWNDKCYLGIDNMITYYPDDGNCFRHGDGCEVFTQFRFTDIPLVEKNCWRLKVNLGQNSNVRINKKSQVRHAVNENTRLPFFHESPEMSGGKSINYIDRGRSPFENGVPEAVHENIKINFPKNPSSRKSQRSDDDEDVWQDSRYTRCVLVKRLNGTLLEKKCYPGNDETDDLKFDFGKNCRMIDGDCYRVITNEETVRQLFNPPPSHILKCVILGKECFLIHGDMLIHTMTDECLESLCRRMEVDPNNPKSFCDPPNCEFPQEIHEKPAKEGQNSNTVELGNVNYDLIPFIMEGLKAIVPEQNFQKKPSGIFYSLAFLYNDSISALLATPNDIPKQPGGSDPSNSTHIPEIPENNDGGNENVPEIPENNENDKNQNDNNNPKPPEKKDEATQTENENKKCNDTKVDKGDEMPNFDGANYPDYYDDGDFQRQAATKSPEMRSGSDDEVWNNPDYTDCIFHMRKRRDTWETKCYPGNHKSEVINPDAHDSCRQIDSECYKVHKDVKFLSSRLSRPLNRILKCVKLADDCFLVDNNLLLYNTNDCFQPPCYKLDNDPEMSGNYCDSADCGHSRHNSRSFGKFKTNKRSDLSKLKPLRILNNDLADPLFQSLKAVVPKANFEENPNALILSIGLLYNDSLIKSPSSGRSKQEDFRYDGNTDFDSVKLEHINGTADKSEEHPVKMRMKDNSTELDLPYDKRSLPKMGPLPENYTFASISKDNSTTPVSEHSSENSNTQELDKGSSHHEELIGSSYKRSRRGRQQTRLNSEENKVVDIPRYDFQYLPIPLSSQPDEDLIFQKKDRKGFKLNTQVKTVKLPYMNGRASDINDKQTSNNEYFFNPHAPFAFLGAYPGTTGRNDTIIIQENSYKNHGGKLPTLQKISTRTIHFGKNWTSHDVDKNVVLEFMANFPWPDWCIPSSNEDSVSNCCELHENCDDAIEPSEKKYGLKNDGLYRRLHCDCDYKFFQCLKANKDIISNSLGVAYFNILGPKCFASSHKVVCLLRNKWKKCIKYGYYQNSKQDFQWLDTPTY